MARKSADDIRKTLEEQILEGEWQNGERLDEVLLAERFGVSRTPLREALRMLSGSGLIELVPRRGAFVRHPDMVELVEMFEVMAELEAFCGRLVARRITAAELVALSASASACEAACGRDDPDAYYISNEQFHQTIYRAAGNAFLTLETTRLQKRLRPFRRMQLRLAGRLRQSLDEHGVILRALRDHDSETAASALRSHVAVQGEKFHLLHSALESSQRS